MFGLKSINLKTTIRNEYFLPLVLFLILANNYNKRIELILKSQKSTLAGPYTNYSKEAFDYIKNNTDKNSVFAFIKPRVLALYSSRSTIGIGIGGKMEEIDKKNSEVGDDYIMTIEDKSNIIFENYISHFDSGLELIWSNERCKIYKRLKPKK